MTSGNGRNTSKVASGKLEKAKLISQESETIEFMFNPTQLVFQQSVRLNEGSGSRTQSGLPKVSFAYPEPCVLTINDILFDTFEEGTSVLEYIGKLIKSVKFTEKGSGAGKRPPVYIFTWGAQQYLRCFVEQITYKLTLFLPDGTPVQARVDMILKQVDESFSKPNGKQSTSANRNTDSRASRTVFG